MLGGVEWVLDRLFAFCASLRLAVVVILSLATLLGVATVYESRYGGPAVQGLVYSSRLFVGVLAGLAINVMASALIRFPWKRRQTGFVVTHIGILVLLSGCLISFRSSVDGVITLAVGDSAREFATRGESLQVTVDGVAHVRPAEMWTEAGYPSVLRALTGRWGEPGWRGGAVAWEVARGVKAEVVRWLPAARVEEAVVADASAGPLVEVRLEGSTPNGGVVDESARVGAGETPLFGGIVLARVLTAGEPAAFLKPGAPAELSGMTRGIVELLAAGETLYFRAWNKEGLRGSGEVVTGKELVKFLAISVSVRGYVPHGRVERSWVAAKVSAKKMADANRAALMAVTVGGVRQEAWVVRGASARMLDTTRGPVSLAYGFGGRELPFTLSLLSAKRTDKPGTTDPDAYESDVMVGMPDGTRERAVITLNHPLSRGGYTLYQARYEEIGGTAVSTFSVRRDPGTWVKYGGSALVCAGIFLMFYMKAYFAKGAGGEAATAAVRREEGEVPVGA